MEIKKNLARIDILNLFEIVGNYGWGTVLPHTIHRVMYLSGTLFLFVNKEQENPFEGYNFTREGYGPYSHEINKGIEFLLKDEYLIYGDDLQELTLGRNFDLEKSQLIESSLKSRWMKMIVQILAIYGEDKIYEFIFRDPQFQKQILANSDVSLKLGSDNPTIKYLEEFRAAFEEQLDVSAASLDEEAYLKLYFDYVFSQILERKQ